MLNIKVLLISSIPVLNLVIGYLFNCMSDTLISEVADTVENNHWDDIVDIERTFDELTNELKEVEEELHED